MARNIREAVGQAARARGGRRLRVGERGAQALEYIGLGGAVAGMMGGAAVFLQHHGGDVGGMLLGHLKNVIGQ